MFTQYAELLHNRDYCDVTLPYMYHSHAKLQPVFYATTSGITPEVKRYVPAKKSLFLSGD